MPAAAPPDASNHANKQLIDTLLHSRLFNRKEKPEWLFRAELSRALPSFHLFGNRALRKLPTARLDHKQP
jgi:hypothetical protein